MLWTLVGIIIILWLLGFGFEVGGNLIHILLVVASSSLCLTSLVDEEFNRLKLRDLPASASLPFLLQ